MSFFTVEKKFIDAHFPRGHGSTVVENERLKIAYNKYTYAGPEAMVSRGGQPKIKLNFVFIHGTGMNKLIWLYHVNRLYEQSERAKDWQLQHVLTVDLVGHGDSAVVNEGKIGWAFRWEDSARDALKIVHHEIDNGADFANTRTTRNIIVGHSLGGFCATMATVYEPRLFDAVVPIEAVLYGNPKDTQRFAKIFNKMSSLLLDTFDDEELFKEYYTAFSFYKTMHPEVLKYFLQDEMIVVTDPETKQKKVKSKASAQNQMSTYLSGSISLPLLMHSLSRVSVPFYHAIAVNGNWNVPASTTYIRSQVPSEFLTTIDFEKGLHLVNGDFPDDVVDLFVRVCNERSKAAIENLAFYPEVRFGGRQKEYVEFYWDLFRQGKIEEASNFTKVVPKLKF